MKYNIKLIEGYIKENKISQAEFCKRCHISRNVLTNIYNDKLIRLINAVKISKLLNMRLEDLIIKN